MKYITLSTVLSLLALTSPSQVDAAPTTTTTGNLQTSKSTKCLALNSLSNGSKIKTSTCSSTSLLQTFQFASSVSRTNTLLRGSITSNLCLDLPDGKAVNGAQVQVWTCNSSNSNQYWNRVGNNIRYAATKYCLDIPDGQAKDFANGLVLQIWECNYNSPNQKLVGPAVVSLTSTATSVKSSSTSSSKSNSTSSKASTTSSGKSNTTTSKSSTTTSKSNTTTSKSNTTTSKSNTTTSKSSTTTSKKTTSGTSSTSSSSASAKSSSTTKTTSTSTSAKTTSGKSTTTSTSTSNKSTTTKSTTTITATPTLTSTSSYASYASSSTTTTTSARPIPTTTITKRSLTSIFKPEAKRMLAWGYDDRKAVEISSGPLISTYHHWELLKVTQMNSKLTYIPTYWGHTKNSSWTAVMDELGDEVPLAVASFNEPDVTSQANMDPITAAISFYENIDKYFGRRGANTISPAIAWNIDGWLVPFMNKCAALGCQVDAIGLHIYLDLNNDTDAAVAEIQRRVNLVYSRTGKPIVLSELGLTAAGGGTEEQMVDFVTKAAAFLDNSPLILAWALSAVFAYGAGWDTYLNSNLAFFNTNGTLRDLAYQFMGTTKPT